MKQVILFTGLLLIIASSLYAQQGQDSVLRKRIYKLKITGVNGLKDRGFLACISDSGILVSTKPFPVQLAACPRQQAMNFSYSDLRTVSLQRRRSVGYGILHGSMIGLGSGFLAGFCSGNDADRQVAIPDFFGSGTFYFTVHGTTALEKGVIAGLTCMVGGAIIGGVIGALSHKKFIIGGQRKKFADMRSVLLGRLYKQPQAE